MLYLELVGGLALLVFGGDALVRGAVAIARRLGVSPLLIGLTLVGFGTSTPELLTSIEAALLGSPGIAVGNVIGSNIANILLILGLAALIRPIRTSPAAFRRDGAAVLLAALACTAIALFGALNRPIGTILLMLLVLYIVLSYLQERSTPGAPANPVGPEAVPGGPALRRSAAAVAMALGGMALTVLGAHFLVGGSIALAAVLGASEAVIGLTVVAVGTSLPELVTSVTAAVRRHGDVAFGNVVGSNIYNVLGILGATALVRPIAVPRAFAEVDVWIMLGATLLLLLFAISGWRLSRIEGGVFLLGYAAYVTWLAATGGA